MNNKQVLKRVLKLLLINKFKFIFALLLSIVSVLGTLFIPIYLGNIIDNISNININNLLLKLYPLVIIIVITSLSLFISTYLMNLISYNITTKLRHLMIEKLLEVPISDIYNYSEGDLLITYTLDVNMIGDTSLQSLTNLVNGIITIITTLVIMLILNYKIGILVFVLTPLSLAFASIISKKIYKTMQKQTKIKSKMSSVINEAFEIHDSIICDNYENITINKFTNLNNELNEVGFKAQFLGALINPITRFINALIYAAITLYGLYNAIYFGLSIGTLQVFLNYTQSYTKPFNDCSMVVGELANTIASAKRVFKILDLEREENLGKVKLEHIDTIEFKNVYFKYPNSDRYILNNVSFKINKNDQVAIVGKTGSGKTTLINILLGFYKIEKGSILINDISLYEYDLAYLRNHISIVLQDSYIFNDNVYNNINYSNNLSLEEVVNYAKETNYDSFVRKYENNYNTIVNNNSISYGESQLLALTRTLAKDNPLVIMDEATSNLDLRTEKLINDTTIKLLENKTCITIAHRISTIRNASYIIVFNNGEINGIGKHKELIKNNELYRLIYQDEFNN